VKPEKRRLREQKAAEYRHGQTVQASKRLLEEIDRLHIGLPTDQAAAHGWYRMHQTLQQRADSWRTEKQKRAQRCGHRWQDLVNDIGVRRIAVLEATDRWRRYNVATIAIQLVDTGEQIRVIADTGASVSLFPQFTLNAALAGKALMPSNNRWRAANGGGTTVLGSTTVKFKMLGSEKIWEHTSEVMRDKGVPNILGVDFWRPKGTVMDMGNNKLILTHPSGSAESIPMSMMEPDHAAVACTFHQEPDTTEAAEKKWVMRLQCDTPLLPNEPVVLEFPAPRELTDESQVY
jgi:hypothetical protein